MTCKPRAQIQSLGSTFALEIELIECGPQQPPKIIVKYLARLRCYINKNIFIRQDSKCLTTVFQRPEAKGRPLCLGKVSPFQQMIVGVFFNKQKEDE
jgi:hypothetical protein